MVLFFKSFCSVCGDEYFAGLEFLISGYSRNWRETLGCLSTLFSKSFLQKKFQKKALFLYFWGLLMMKISIILADFFEIFNLWSHCYTHWSFPFFFHRICSFLKSFFEFYIWIKIGALLRWWDEALSGFKGSGIRA